MFLFLPLQHQPGVLHVALSICQTASLWPPLVVFRVQGSLSGHFWIFWVAFGSQLPGRWGVCPSPLVCRFVQAGTCLAPARCHHFLFLTHLSSSSSSSPLSCSLESQGVAAFEDRRGLQQPPPAVFFRISFSVTPPPLYSLLPAASPSPPPVLRLTD